jgi:hypothetical protein
MPSSATAVPAGPGPTGSPAADGLSPVTLLRAFRTAAFVVVAALVLVWGGGMLPDEVEAMAALGAGAAVVATGLAVGLHGRFLGARALASLQVDGRLVASRLQSLMAAALGIKLAAVTIGVLALRSLELKFSQVTAFAVAFAAASLLCQVTAASILVRALSRRRSVAPSGVTSGDHEARRQAAGRGRADQPTGGPS